MPTDYLKSEAISATITEIQNNTSQSPYLDQRLKETPFDSYLTRQLSTTGKKKFATESSAELAKKGQAPTPNLVSVHKTNHTFPLRACHSGSSIIF